MPFRLAGVDEGRTGRLEFGERRAMGQYSWYSIRGRSGPKRPAGIRRGQKHCARRSTKKQAAAAAPRTVVPDQSAAPAAYLNNSMQRTVRSATAGPERYARAEFR